ncbi:MAG TPA: DNA polymerase I [Chloroflexota bacterium]|nr:DNA polymerase I [Chloroflexota bacterium]
MPTDTPSVLLLVDGHALVHRAFHAVPAGFMTSKGETTNAVFGFTSMLLRALEDVRPEYAAVTFDRSAPTFRHREYADYKATRPRMDDGLRPQFDRVREVVHAFSIPIFEIDGYEADDLLGCLANQAESASVDTMIMTGDLDLLQLVTTRVRVMAPRGRISDTVVYDVAGVFERYGLAPYQVPDLKALSGDTSDNIKGVPGIGPKTASKLLTQFDTVEDLYRRLDQLPAKQRDLLAEHERLVRANKRLTTIDRTAPCILDLDACRIEDYDREKALALFQTLEFRSLLNKLPRQLGSAGANSGAGGADGAPRQMGLFEGPAAAAATRAADAAHAAASKAAPVTELAALPVVIEELRAAGGFVLRPIATQRNAINFDLAGFALAVSTERGWFVPASGDQALNALRPLLEDERVTKTAHNAKAVYTLLAERGVRLRGLTWDTMIAAYLVNQSVRSTDVQELVFHQFGREIKGTGTLATKGGTLLDVAPERLASEAILEAQLLYQIQAEQLDDLQERAQLDLFKKVEVPLIWVLSSMERAGVKVDVAVLGEMSREMSEQIRYAELEIYNSVGHQFTINSPHQLGKVLVDELHLPLTKRTKTGFSTDATVLEELSGAHPVIEQILTYRQLTKLRSTYIEALPLLINPGTGRIHTTFNQAVAATGRLSSEAPNLQNIPIRTEIGRRIRRAFVAESKDHVLLAADYAQIELRIAAHITGDPLLKQAFANDEDVHTSTASIVFTVPREEVTSDQRRLAKTTNFAVLYGISDFGLSQRVGISRDEAAPFIQAYLAKYTGIRKYIDETIRSAKQKGYVETPLGRRRSLPELRAPNAAVRAAGKRAAINMPIQGAQADLIKLATIAVQDELEHRELKTRMLLQVHDELVFEVPRGELDEVAELVRSKMEGAMTFDVPVKVEIKTGDNWYDMATRAHA